MRAGSYARRFRPKECKPAVTRGCSAGAPWSDCDHNHNKVAVGTEIETLSRRQARGRLDAGAADLRAGALVVGSAGAGKTTALAALVAEWSGPASLIAVELAAASAQQPAAAMRLAAALRLCDPIAAVRMLGGWEAADELPGAALQLAWAAPLSGERHRLDVLVAGHVDDPEWRSLLGVAEVGQRYVLGPRKFSPNWVRRRRPC